MSYHQITFSFHVIMSRHHVTSSCLVISFIHHVTSSCHVMSCQYVTSFMSLSFNTIMSCHHVSSSYLVIMSFPHVTSYQYLPEGGKSHEVAVFLVSILTLSSSIISAHNWQRRRQPQLRHHRQYLSKMHISKNCYPLLSTQTPGPN